MLSSNNDPYPFPFFHTVKQRPRTTTPRLFFLPTEKCSNGFDIGHINVFIFDRFGICNPNEGNVKLGQAYITGETHWHSSNILHLMVNTSYWNNSKNDIIICTTLIIFQSTNKQNYFINSMEHVTVVFTTAPHHVQKNDRFIMGFFFNIIVIFKTKNYRASTLLTSDSFVVSLE